MIAGCPYLPPMWRCAQPGRDAGAMPGLPARDQPGQQEPASSRSGDTPWLERNRLARAQTWRNRIAWAITNCSRKSAGAAWG